MIENRGTNFLENEKLILRKLKETDLSDFFIGILQDKELQKNYMIPYYEKIEEAQVFFEGLLKNYEKDSFYCWGIEEKESGKLAGMINIADKNEGLCTCEIGYCIIQLYRKKGYASAALKMVIDYMSSLGFHRITAEHFIENEISGKVMRNAGMRKESIRKEAVFYQDKFHDIVEYVWINEGEMYD